MLQPGLLCAWLMAIPAFAASAPPAPAAAGVAAKAGAAVTIVEDGRAKLPIIAGSVKDAADELRLTIKRISGAELKSEAPGGPGVYVGLAKDFPALKLELPADSGPEGFLLRTDGTSVYLIAAGELGVRHAVTTFLHRLGCRWFFPGAVWEIVPKQAAISVSFDERQSPSFSIGRHIHYGFGAYGPCEKDLHDWNRHNRMGGPVPVGCGHSWIGLNHEKDFGAHPDWFALVDGARKPGKPCYSHPEVIKIAVRHALEQAAAGAAVISMSPPDGLGFCTCDNCLAASGAGERIQKHGTAFMKHADGTLVSVASETLFKCVNEVAAAVAEKYPNVRIGCMAYSAYSQPPSFKLQPNVFVMTSTAYRRTDLTLAEQLAGFKSDGCQAGIRDYFSVYQWDWDVKPPRGKLAPAHMRDAFARYYENGVRAVNAESSNNWAPRGLSYYLAAQVMWDVKADTDALLRDFYDKAFGPAAEPMKAYYKHWYGAGALGGDEAAADETGEAKEEDIKGSTLQQMFADLDAAAGLAKDRSDCLARIDHLRMYVHYLLLRQHTQQAGAGKKKDKAAVIEAVKAETEFGARLTYTNMLHSRPLIGKAFDRRFKAYANILKDVPESQTAGKGWRKIGQAPTHEEMEQLWAADRAALAAK